MLSEVELIKMAENFLGNFFFLVIEIININ